MNKKEAKQFLREMCNTQIISIQKAAEEKILSALETIFVPSLSEEEFSDLTTGLLISSKILIKIIDWRIETNET